MRKIGASRFRALWISSNAPVVRSSSLLMCLPNCSSVIMALFWASFTSFSFSPFAGTVMVTLLPRSAFSHVFMTSSSCFCMLFCKINSLGIKGVPE
jgi:hypothetical protein